jgi:hypothetical protein
MSKVAAKTWSDRDRKRYLYAHIKRDGHFTNVIRSTADGRVTIFSSLPRDITDSLRWHPDYEKWRSMPKGLSLLGELWLPGKRAEYIKTAISERDERLRFDVFGFRIHPSYQPHQMAAIPLHVIGAECSRLGLSFVPFLDIPNDTANFTQLMYVDYIQKLLDSVCSTYAHSEGIVLKNGNMLDWSKLKRRRTIDLVICGFEPGEGKYAGKVGAIKVKTTEGFEVANVSGMTDGERDIVTQTSGELVGKVIEVEYQNIGAAGRLRHPSFVRFREDKTAAECLANQDDDLAAYWNSADTLPPFGAE